MRVKMRTLGLVLFTLIGSIAFAQTEVMPEKKGNKKERIEKLKTELDLSDEQVQKIRAVIQGQKAEREELNAQRKEASTEVKEEKAALRMKTKELNAQREAAFAEILTPEQLEKYKAISEQRKEARKERRRK